MTEKGSDELLAELADENAVEDGVRAENERIQREEGRVTAEPENEHG